jgi:hypothetical protein
VLADVTFPVSTCVMQIWVGGAQKICISFYEQSSPLSDEDDLLFTGALSPFGLRFMSTAPAITWDSHHLSEDISHHTDHLPPQFGSNRGQLRILGLSPEHYLTAHSLGSHQDPSASPFMSSFHPGNISDNSSLPSTKVLISNRVLDPSLSISLPNF